MDEISRRRERAREIYRRMFSQQAVDDMDAHIEAGGFGARLAELAQEFAFGVVWSGPVLDRKTRSVATIAALAALGRRDELTKHLGIGLNHGLTLEEIEELIVQIVPYAGFPAAAQAMEAAHAMMRQRGITPPTR